METLVGMRCTACRRGEPTVTAEEMAAFAPQIPAWHMVEQDHIKRLERQYRFADFVQAMAFTNTVGELAEKEAHHPALLTEWGKVTVTWWTHKIKNLHRNDFIMASQSDQAYNKGKAKPEAT